MRDEKMLKNLATHDVQDVFSLVDKCTRAVEGHAWHSKPIPKAGKANKPNADAATQSSGKKKKKKKAAGKDKPLAGAPTNADAIAARGPRGIKRPRKLSGSDEGGPRCPVHNSKCHSAEECREIKKLVEQLCE
jgi:hypothetical protein